MLTNAISEEKKSFFLEKFFYGGIFQKNMKGFYYARIEPSAGCI